MDLDFRHPAVLRELTENTRGGSELLPVEALGPDPILHSESLNLDYLALPRDGADPLVRFAGDHISRLLIRLRANQLSSWDKFPHEVSQAGEAFDLDLL